MGYCDRQKGNVNTSEELEFIAEEKVVVVEESKPVENDLDDALKGLFYHIGFDGDIEYDGQDFINLNRDFY